MKKVLCVLFVLLFFCSFTVPPAYAACNPPTDYSSCPERHPDLNLQVRGYERISGSLNLVRFNHKTDPKAPQLATLIEGNARPNIGSLYQVYDWNWNTNRKGGLIQKPPDAPSDFASLAGFSTQAGQAILVPNSGYDIGSGYETIVLHASANSITLKYTREDSVAEGYTIHLENFRVNPQLVSFYNKLNRGGRKELPALLAGMKIGEAMTGEVLVSVRDTGSFMDPRWLGDWWQTLDPATALELLLEALGLQGAVTLPAYGSCSSETNGNEGAGIKRGASFEKKFVFAFHAPSDPKKMLEMVLSGKNLEFPQNEKISQGLEEVNNRLALPNYSPTVSEKTAMGEIWYLVCEQETKRTFTVKGDVNFETPGWMDSTAGLGTHFDKALTETKTVGSQAQENNPKNLLASTKLAQAQSCSADAPHEIVPSCVSCQNTLFCYGNRYRLCQTDPQIPSPTGNLTQFLPRETFGETLKYNSVTFSVPSGGVFVCDSNVFGCNNESCKKEGGEGSFDPCERYSPIGESQETQEICIGGSCKTEPIGVGNPLESLLEELKGVGGSLQRALEELKKYVPGTVTRTYIITPIIKTPYAQTVDTALRENTFAIFKLPGTNLDFKNALSPTTHGVSASPEEDKPSESEIYGQKGVRDAYDYVQQALTPANF